MNLRQRFPRPELFAAFRVFELKAIPTGTERKGYGRAEVRTLLQHFCQSLTRQVCCAVLCCVVRSRRCAMRNATQLTLPLSLPPPLQVYGGQEGETAQVPPLFDTEKVLEQWGHLVYRVAARPRYTDPPLAEGLRRAFADHGADLPDIFRLIAIMRVLALSTATVERAFWIINNILQTKQRNRLTVESCDMLLRIKMNGPPPFTHTPVPGATRGAPQWSPAAQRLILAVTKSWRALVPRRIDTAPHGVRSM